MIFTRIPLRCSLSLLALLFAPFAVCAAQGGNAGTIHGTVTDPSGAVIPNAAVHLTNGMSGLNRTANSDATGQFTFTNIPFNPYHVQVTAKGFSALSQDFELRSVV